MCAPRIRPLAEATLPQRAAASVRAIAGALPQRHGLFVVVQSGVFADRWFEPGDLLVFGPVPPATQQPVVLIPRGHGAPQLGHARGDHLYGVHGEPCSTARWLVLGALLEHRRQVNIGQVGAVAYSVIWQAAGSEAPHPRAASAVTSTWASPRAGTPTPSEPLALASWTSSHPRPATAERAASPQLSLFASAA